MEKKIGDEQTMEEWTEKEKIHKMDIGIGQKNTDLLNMKKYEEDTEDGEENNNRMKEIER